MKLGIDVESGENSFEEFIRAALKSSSTLPGISLFLIGNSLKIKKSFPVIDEYPNIYLINSNSVIGMDEAPLRAVKSKKDSSVVVGTKLLKNGTIDIFFSPGNTGATVASSILNIGRIHGIKKPAIAAFFPRQGLGETLILDIGANPDCTVENLYHNALLGKLFYKMLYKTENPRIGLLNMGKEHGKGRYNLKKSFSLLNSIEGFIGNVEGYNVFNSSVDVVVCDGFTGNSILKTAEACKDLFINTAHEIIEEKRRNSVLSNLFKFKKAAKWYKNKFTEKLIPEFYGAAPLLGVNGTVLVGHGACKEADLINAILFAKKLYELDFLKNIKQDLKKIL